MTQTSSGGVPAYRVFDSAARSWVLSRFSEEQFAACLAAYPDAQSEAPALIRTALEAIS